MPSSLKQLHLSTWHPPSHKLRKAGGIWHPKQKQNSISYPDWGNDAFAKIEDESFWFKHRNDCILNVASRYLDPRRDFWDIGAGNGFVAHMLEKNGFSTVLVEPGRGACHAQRRGLTRIVQSTLDDAGLKAGSLANVGCFDVMEHISDDRSFCNQIRRLLSENGYFIFTVPAGQWLWSNDDVLAGHYRRYSARTLRSLFSSAGLQLVYHTHIFVWLGLSIFLLRSLPSFLAGAWRKAENGKRCSVACDIGTMRATHTLPIFLNSVISKIHRWELLKIKQDGHIPTGTSILGVAKKLN